MKWRHCISSAVVLGKRTSKARPIPSTSNLASMPASSSSSPATRGTDGSGNGRKNDRGSAAAAASRIASDDGGADVDPSRDRIGGGAINEKPRSYGSDDENEGVDVYGDGDTGGNETKTSWNPSANLSHMLHALVGLDRYPNYLGRFKDVSDMQELETALEARLSDVRRQRSEIVERRAGIRRVVGRYLSMNGHEVSNAEDEEPSDCSGLWSRHPSLSPPKTWLDLKERKILQGQAFKVAYHSISKSLSNQESIRKRKSKGRKSEKQTMPTVEEITKAKITVELDPSLLEDWMCQEMFDVYSFPLLTNEFCSLLRKTLRELSALAETDEFSHLSLGRRVIDLDTVGLGWITDLIFHLYVQPISRHLFAATEKLLDAPGGADRDPQTAPILDWRQGYVAGYSADPSGSKGAARHRLVPHTDDSEVTLNCCLGEETFEGGDVEFYGLRGAPEEGVLVGRARRPNVGTALLHSGRHLHAVSDVSRGDRYALIVWSRSWQRLRSNTCPCCWLNRRQDTTCISDKRWN